jgi:hypothetical protein
MCEYCKYRESNPNNKPCSVCIQWGEDGHLDFTKFKREDSK